MEGGREGEKVTYRQRQRARERGGGGARGESMLTANTSEGDAHKEEHYTPERQAFKLAVDHCRPCFYFL
jgi:hypothetical protein